MVNVVNIDQFFELDGHDAEVAAAIDAFIVGPFARRTKIRFHKPPRIGLVNSDQAMSTDAGAWLLDSDDEEGKPFNGAYLIATGDIVLNRSMMADPGQLVHTTLHEIAHKVERSIADGQPITKEHANAHWWVACLNIERAYGIRRISTAPGPQWPPIPPMPEKLAADTTGICELL